MEPKIYLITGVMASGKSTTAELLARKYLRAVHLRGDIFRKMIVSGREEMAENPSDEAVRQLHLRYELAAGAARRYWEAGFTVVLQDNYYGEEWPRMLERFKGLPLRAVVLCPPVRVVEARLHRVCGREPLAGVYGIDAPGGILAGQRGADPRGDGGGHPAAF